MITTRLQEFVDFVNEREQTRINKEAGLPKAEWTNDPTLQKFRFCNVRRMDDRVSKILIEEVLTNDKLTEHDKLINIYACRIFNKPYMFDEDFFPVTTVQSYDVANQDAILREFRRDKLFSAAYQVAPAGGKHKGLSKRMQATRSIGDLVEMIKSQTFSLDEMRTFPTPKEQVAYINRHVKMLGNFGCTQIYLDLCYAGLTGYTNDDFSFIGGSALWGLQYILEDDSDRNWRVKRDSSSSDQETYEPHLKALKNHVDLPLMDIQHSLCEFRKYTDLKSGKKKNHNLYVDGREDGVTWTIGPLTKYCEHCDTYMVAGMYNKYHKDNKCGMLKR